ncbi:MAG: hypothetical protein AB1810_05900 [Pseudomonadota bacterium]
MRVEWVLVGLLWCLPAGAEEPADAAAPEPEFLEFLGEWDGLDATEELALELDDEALARARQVEGNKDE